jgi:Domain of unknown function (DUF4351)
LESIYSRLKLVKNMTTTEFRDDYDLPWKEMIEDYFEPFMCFFFPEIHAEIDWSRGYEFLDQELTQVVRDAELGKRVVDKLVKVWTRSGKETWVLLNIEVQSQEESNFSARIFTHYYRLRDCYNVPIVNLAILGDDRSSWRPGPFQAAQWGCEVDFRFPMVKLLDYQSRWTELEASRNPFALVVMAHLKTKETKKDLQDRKEWKFRLTRMLYERDYERQDILRIFRFLDWILELPEGLKQEFNVDLKRYEQEKQMPYITSIERMGIAEGLQQGLQQEQERQRSLVSRLLTRRVGSVPENLVKQVEQLTIPQLEALTEALLDFTQLDDLVQWLKNDR